MLQVLTNLNKQVIVFVQMRNDVISIAKLVGTVVNTVALTLHGIGYMWRTVIQKQVIICADKIECSLPQDTKGISLSFASMQGSPTSH